MAEVSVYPYGNAKTSRAADGSVSFTCQHGPDECQGNLMLGCGLNSTGFTLNGLKFFSCVESKASGNHNWAQAVVFCASAFGLDSKSIIECAGSAKGRLIMDDNGNKTNTLVPAHQYVPWITVNGQHNTTEENMARQDLLQFVCDKFEGTKIAACKKKE
jgi:interferon gamma-inducible protein 30